MQVNWALIPECSARRLQATWETTLKQAELALTRVLRDFYSYAERASPLVIDLPTYNSLISKKARKASRIFGRTVNEGELRNLNIRRLRRFQRNKQLQSYGPNTPSHSNVVNLSEQPLSSQQEDLLSRGLNFVPFPREMDRFPFINTLRAAAKKSMEDIKDLDDRTVVRALWNQHVIRPCCRLPPNAYSGYNLGKENRDALHELQRLKNIMICRADKGNKVVIWDRTAYQTEANKHLGSDAYVAISDDDHKRVYEEVINAIKLHFPDEDTRKRLLPTSSRPGKFYMLPKIHKDINPTPGRPIISNIKTATEKLSRWLHEELYPVLKSTDSFLQSTDDFLRTFDKTKDDIADTTLLTMDVESLFTSIETTNGVEAIRSLLKDQNWPDERVAKICELLTVVLTSNTFAFNGRLYRQTRGTAMGTPVGPTYASLYVAYVEQRFLRECTIKPRLWKRYVDDILIAWPGTVDQLSTFVNNLNEQCELKFTTELNLHQEVPFLDCLLFRDLDGVWQSRAYSKIRGDKSYIHAASGHHPSIKRLTIRNEARRMRKLCSMDNDFEAALEDLHSQFLARGYSHRQIARQFDYVRRSTRDKILSGAPAQDNQNSRDFHTVFTYNPAYLHLQSTVDRTLQKAPPHIRQKLRKPNVRFRNPTNLANLLAQHEPAIRNQSWSGKCHDKRCANCTDMQETHTYKSAVTNLSYRVKGNHDCKSHAVVYEHHCLHCSAQYVGQAGTKYNLRANNRRKDIKQKRIIADGATAHMVENPSHKMATVIIEGPVEDEMRRKKREKYWIGQLMSDFSLNNTDHPFKDI